MANFTEMIRSAKRNSAQCDSEHSPAISVHHEFCNEVFHKDINTNGGLVLSMFTIGDLNNSEHSTIFYAYLSGMNVKKNKLNVLDIMTITGECSNDKDVLDGVFNTINDIIDYEIAVIGPGLGRIFWFANDNYRVWVKFNKGLIDNYKVDEKSEDDSYIKTKAMMISNIKNVKNLSVKFDYNTRITDIVDDIDKTNQIAIISMVEKTKGYCIDNKKYWDKFVESVDVVYFNNVYFDDISYKDELMSVCVVNSHDTYGEPVKCLELSKVECGNVVHIEYAGDNIYKTGAIITKCDYQTAMIPTDKDMDKNTCYDIRIITNDKLSDILKSTFREGSEYYKILTGNLNTIRWKEAIDDVKVHYEMTSDKFMRFIPDTLFNIDVLKNAIL